MYWWWSCTGWCTKSKWIVNGVLLFFGAPFTREQTNFDISLYRPVAKQCTVMREGQSRLYICLFSDVRSTQMQEEHAAGPGYRISRAAATTIYYSWAIYTAQSRKMAKLQSPFARLVSLSTECKERRVVPATRYALLRDLELPAGASNHIFQDSQCEMGQEEVDDTMFYFTHPNLCQKTTGKAASVWTQPDTLSEATYAYDRCSSICTGS